MIAVFFGGRSCEHDISIITGLQAFSACDRRCVGVYIDPDGVWWAADSFDSASAVRAKAFKGRRVHIRPSEPYLYCKNKRAYKIDAALVCMHGMNGEDGTLQGLFELCSVPYTGSDVCASAVGMNKLRTKAVFERAGLKVLPYTAIGKAEYERDAGEVTRRVRELGYPVIVKPCNLGSSIGISVAHSQAELFTALRIAFEWDSVAVAERALTDFTEVNIAVLKKADGSILLSDTEQPVGWTEFLSFGDKYAGDVKNTRHKIPAEVDADVTAQICAQAELAFTAVGCDGVARMDFMVKDGQVYANEINTVPGSLSNGLFASQMSFSALINELIDGAIARKARADGIKRVYRPTMPIISIKP